MCWVNWDLMIFPGHVFFVWALKKKKTAIFAVEVRFSVGSFFNNT